MFSTGRLKSKYAAMFTTLNNKNSLKPVNTSKQSTPLWHNIDPYYTLHPLIISFLSSHSENVANFHDEEQ